jgi:hypothetical protein
MTDELLDRDEHIQKSEVPVATSEIARGSMAGTLLGAVVGAVIGLVVGAVFFGLPATDQSSRDTTLFLVALVVGVIAGATAGFVFGGGRGIRDAQRHAEADARGQPVSR